MSSNAYALDFTKLDKPAPKVNLQNSIAKLVLSLVKILAEVLEKESLRRLSNGTLTEIEMENLGLAFIETKEKIFELSQQFGFKPEDLNLALTQQSRESLDSQLQSNQLSLVDVLDKIVDKGALISGEVVLSVANVDLISLNLVATLSSIDRLIRERKK